MSERFHTQQVDVQQDTMFELLIITRVYLQTVAGRNYQKWAQQLCYFLLIILRSHLKQFKKV